MASLKVIHYGGASEFIVRSSAPFVGKVDAAVMVVAGTLFHMIPASLRIMCSAAFVILWIVAKLEKVVSESIFAVKGLGLEIRTRRVWRRSSQFIDIARISDICINEALYRFGVVTYMAILIREEDNMLIPYENILPPVTILQRVYKECWKELYHEP
ncbi:hypothetical protein M427DRAFT_403651 [Gonapodya prolifera JEL478]|uniref:Phosphatidylinositol N-acetylglucosaminyltransferase subunit H conserved domain-containing protein n=1 Tax=Gonapodya prolifera (strain JEL478) TaxID=1344416 RepID=A0A139ATW3_GONPJ|nr:hypothetical protein M427DRAFT_403651 [Gonapodya prolifera JEL478]|eukprot:KXS20172.1 hypothetical protein M427DRAFT_403651 [Gonapodya prolifera JEL478]